MTEGYWAIDRIEAAWAYLSGDDGATFHVPRTWLPTAAREADVLRLERPAGEDGTAATLRFRVDGAETRRRTAAADRARDALPDGPEGDLDL